MRKILGGLYVASLICVVYLAVHMYIYPEVVAFELTRGVQLLNCESEYYNYQSLSDNTCLCDLATVSNIVYRMKQDSFKVTKCISADGYIDIILKRGDEEYRLFYDDKQLLTVVAKEYENSYKPITYINERNSKQ